MRTAREDKKGSGAAVMEKANGLMNRFVSTTNKSATPSVEIAQPDGRTVVGTSTISADFTITGQIVCKGQAQLDGEVFGNVECHHLIVGKNGHIKGDIKAEDVVVYGRVDGLPRGNQDESQRQSG